MTEEVAVDDGWLGWALATGAAEPDGGVALVVRGGSCELLRHVRPRGPSSRSFRGPSRSTALFGSGSQFHARLSASLHIYITIKAFAIMGTPKRRVLVLNPNSSKAMTEGMVKAVGEVQLPSVRHHRDSYGLFSECDSLSKLPHTRRPRKHHQASTTTRTSRPAQTPSSLHSQRVPLISINMTLC